MVQISANKVLQLTQQLYIVVCQLRNFVGLDLNHMPAQKHYCITSVLHIMHDALW